MSFSAMRERLLAIVRERVRNGEMTERGLARSIGVSQPHIHNVLKGVRLLSTELADDLLAELRLRPGDLIAAPPKMEDFPFRQVALMSGKIGAGALEFARNKTEGFAPVPAEAAEMAVVPLAIRLGRDPFTSPRFEEGDLIVADCGIEARTKIEKTVVYIAATSEGPRLRYIRIGAARVYFPSEQCLEHPHLWGSVAVPADGLAGVVLARVVWVSRQLDGDGEWAKAGEGLSRIAGRPRASPGPQIPS